MSQVEEGGKEPPQVEIFEIEFTNPSAFLEIEKRLFPEMSVRLWGGSPWPQK